MPALPFVPGALRVEFMQGDEASHFAGSRFYLGYTGGPPNSTDCDDLAGDVHTAWATHVAPIVQSTEALKSVTITDLSSATGAVGTWEGNEPGTLSGTQLPASACAVVNHKIGRSYRGGRPRTYLRCGVSSYLSGTNIWDSTALTDILAAWQGWIGEILDVTGLSISLQNIINIGYYSGFLAHEYPSGRYKNIPQLRKVDGVPTPFVDTITDSTVASKLGSQRRRLNT